MESIAHPIISPVLRSVIALTLAVLSTAPAGATNLDWRYTVQLNDTLTGISRRYLKDPKDWSAISKANSMTMPDHLRIGRILHIPTYLLRYRSGQGVLSDVHGTVHWRVKGADFWLDASKGQTIPSGSELKTGQASSTLLRLADNSELLLVENTYLKIDNLSQFDGELMLDSTLSLQRGQATITVNPTKRALQRLKVLTPSAQAVVRGTKFRVSYDDKNMREETLEGLVEVSAAERNVSVAMQMGTLVRQGEPPNRPVKLLEAPDISNYPLKFEQLPQALVLPELAGAKSWVVELSSDVQFKNIIWSANVHGSELTLPSLDSGTYALHLRAVDENGLQGADALHIFSVENRLTLLSPQKSALVRFAQPTFSWTPVMGASTYRLQISRNPDFSSLVYDIQSKQPTWQPETDLPGETLYWRVAGIFGQQQVVWSSNNNFTYKPGPLAVDLGKSIHRIDGSYVYMDLRLPPQGLVYEAILSSSEIGIPPFSRVRNSDGLIKLPRPTSGVWYLAVRLIDPIDNTPGYSSVQKITVLPRSN